MASELLVCCSRTERAHAEESGTSWWHQPRCSACHLEEINAEMQRAESLHVFSCEHEWAEFWIISWQILLFFRELVSENTLVYRDVLVWSGWLNGVICLLNVIKMLFDRNETDYRDIYIYRWNLIYKWSLNSFTCIKIALVLADSPVGQLLPWRVYFCMKALKDALLQGGVTPLVGTSAPYLPVSDGWAPAFVRDLFFHHHCCFHYPSGCGITHCPHVDPRPWPLDRVYLHHNTSSQSQWFRFSYLKGKLRSSSA